MTTTKKQNTETFVKSLFKKEMNLNDICTNVMKESISGNLDKEIPFDQVQSTVKTIGIENNFILSDLGLSDKVKSLLQTGKEIPNSYSEVLKLADNLANKYYKSTAKALQALKDNWNVTESEFPVNYRLETEWNDTIENQVLFEIYKANPDTSISELMEACRTNLMTKETESSPAHKLTEKRADQYTKKVLKWFKLFQKISEKHGDEIVNMFN